MYNPGATYRIQFNKDFTFRDLAVVVPYFKKLGIRTIYASPIFAATKGSTHGYDGIDPNRINPEIGTEEELLRLSRKLKAAGIGWIQDIVPNHMAYESNNLWLYDFLEKGEQSNYHTFFDCSAISALYDGPIMAPFLGGTLTEVIQNNELVLAIGDRGIELKYYDNTFPVSPETYGRLIELSEKNPVQQSILQELQTILSLDDKNEYADRWTDFKKKISRKKYRQIFVSAIEKFNQQKDQFEELARQQHYELCHWEEANHRINYRRFFTISGLICLNIHRDEVFDAFHQLIGRLSKHGVFNGLRIDHIDGLLNPEKYLNDLRALVGLDKYIIVEKILEPEESLPARWPIQGNTGYDFLSTVNNLFTNTGGKARFTRFYRKFIGEGTSVQDEILENKRYILEERMAGESANLFRLFQKLELLNDAELSEADPENLKKAIDFFLVHCPVYRFYGNKFPLDSTEIEAVERVLYDVELYEPQLAAPVALLRKVLIEKPTTADSAWLKKVTRFYKRCMQFSGPLMAKGVEDTSMYTYNRFAGHNEVGDSPRNFGIHIEEFHEAMKQRQERWPLSMNATATHDTKRGEDVRTRLNVLTDLDKEWIKKTLEWRDLNADLKSKNAPDPNDEYLIYQTIIGAHPFPGQDRDNFEERIREYLQKALREAKTHTNWTAPDEKYENSAGDFAVELLNVKNPFWGAFKDFHRKVSDFGIVNSLAQVMLKFTCPGIPDIYQGTELWDLSLVDPDNRRAIDYITRGNAQKDLAQFNGRSSAETWKELWERRYDGVLKMHLIQSLLIQRRKHADVFERGDYQPLEIRGPYKENVCAYARKFRHEWYVTVVPVNIAQLCSEKNCDLESFDWEDTRLILPEDLSPMSRNILMDEESDVEGEIRIGELFSVLPVALIKFRTENERASGILMHITSLPSAFGVGDLGPEAKDFIDFLYETKQRFWQILPLNPTTAPSAYSPYSSVSSRAGNTMLISPELLVKEGLLKDSDLRKWRKQPTASADFSAAEGIRKTLFEFAWNRYSQGNFPDVEKAFHEFCQKENSWLDDFSLFMIIRDKESGKPWFAWPEETKDRNPEALQRIREEFPEELEKVKWLQFIFYHQWKQLRKYCRKRGVALFGDIPIYVSHNSADVWANRDIFRLYSDGRIKGVAGVPPDYFSETGQLWGMPVFEWKKLKKQNYQWWIDRLRVNRQLFDLIRIDHFRAFADYWEVPAGEETAINGKWKTGPGMQFFEHVKEVLGEIPFVAEDLGEISPEVFQLRDDLQIPGMKVLQFGFVEDMAQSDHIPHNFTKRFVVYTGTHDNDTVSGWFKSEGKKFKDQIERYVGRKLKAKDFPQVFCQMAEASVAKTAILPIQDLLSLGGGSRMNNPGGGDNNWTWRLLPDQISDDHRKKLRQWTVDYNRD